jgi:hypothetical protein
MTSPIAQQLAEHESSPDILDHPRSSQRKGRKRGLEGGEGGPSKKAAVEETEDEDDIVLIGKGAGQWEIGSDGKPRKKVRGWRG